MSTSSNVCAFKALIIGFYPESAPTRLNPHSNERQVLGYCDEREEAACCVQSLLMLLKQNFGSTWWCGSTIRENRQLVPDEPVEFEK